MIEELLPALRRLGIDPADGVTFVAADRLAARPVDPGQALVVLPAGTAGSEHPPLPGRHAHGSDPLALLHRLYPVDHPVRRLDGDAAAVPLADVTAGDVARGGLLLAPVAPEVSGTSPFGLPWLVARLRAPDGCPWDREQDHTTLRRFLLEEAYEVYDLLQDGSTPQLAEELGDLLLQVILHAQYAAEAGVFDLADVQAAIMAKIVRRHPHVFGEVVAGSADEVVRNWESIKAGERADRVAADAAGAPADPDMPAAFAGLSRSLPALAYADEMQGRASALGYDWPDLDGVIEKVAEEAEELLAASDAGTRSEEYGDLLFVLVNLGRKLGIDPEAALRSASRKFARRFAAVERLAADDGVELRALAFDELDALWERAKSAEREEAAMPGATR